MSRIRLTWDNASTTIVEQRVYRSTSPLDIDNMPEPLAVLPRRNREYLDSTIEDGLTYYYAVSSVLPDYSELFSKEIKVEASPAESDPYWDKVVALLHFDGSFADETGRVWTALGAVHTMANEHAFGGIGAYFPGSGSGLEGMPLIPATGDWTLELRFMPDPGYANRHIIGQNTRSGAGAINRFVVEQSGENQITVGHNNGSQWRFLYINYTPSTEGFNSLMVSREGNRICGSVNGSEIVRTAELGGLAFAQVPFTIGVYSADVHKSFVGFIDEFRFTKGVARYTENFTPPTEPFPNN